MRISGPIAATLVIVACSSGDGGTPPQVFASLAVTSTATTINKTAPGNTAQLTATPKDARNNNIAGLPAATFTSGNQSAATVNATGLVTAVDIGTAIITASLTAGAVTQTGTLTITVQANPAAQNFPVAATAGNVFDPSAVTMRVGDMATWTFSGSHTVTFDGGPTPPANIGTAANPVSSGSVPRTFTVAGTYPYHCEIHGSATAGMRGSIVVNP